MASEEILVQDEKIRSDALTMELIGSQERRKKIINEMLSIENTERKLRSYKQIEIYEDRMEPFVIEELLSQFQKPETVSKIPKSTFVNVQKKVVSKQATLYRCPPRRSVDGLSEQQLEKLKDFYEENDWNEAMGDINTAFKAQDQVTLWVAPVANRLRPRVLYNHMVDVIPHPEDPAIPLVYLVSPFDRSLTRYYKGDGSNAEISDADDAKLTNWKILVWTSAANFIMNGKGEIVSQILPNPIGALPFVDISRRKNLSFFLDGGKALSDFTVKFNAAISDAWYVVRMQGWAIGWMKGPAAMVPESLEIGPSKMIHLPTNEQTGEKLEIGFTSPESDISGTMQFLETLVALFLSSQGIDPKEVAMRLEGRTFSSGIERLLAMLEVFEASEGDMKVLAKAERALFRLLVLWNNVSRASDMEGLLPSDLTSLNEKSVMKVEYKRPEMVQTETERVNGITEKRKAGYMSLKMAIKKLYNVDEEGAQSILEEILRDEAELAQLKKEINDEFGLTPEEEGKPAPEEEDPSAKSTEKEKVDEKAKSGKD